MNIKLMIIIILFILISLFILFNKKGTEHFQNNQYAPFISYENELSSGIQNIEYKYIKGPIGPKGDPGQNATDQNIITYLDSVYNYQEPTTTLPPTTLPPTTTQPPPPVIMNFDNDCGLSNTGASGPDVDDNSYFENLTACQCELKCDTKEGCKAWHHYEEGGKCWLKSEANLVNDSGGSGKAKPAWSLDYLKINTPYELSGTYAKVNTNDVIELEGGKYKYTPKGLYKKINNNYYQKIDGVSNLTGGKTMKLEKINTDWMFGVHNLGGSTIWDSVPTNFNYNNPWDIPNNGLAGFSISQYTAPEKIPRAYKVTCSVESVTYQSETYKISGIYEITGNKRSGRYIYENREQPEMTIVFDDTWHENRWYLGGPGFSAFRHNSWDTLTPPLISWSSGLSFHNISALNGATINVSEHNHIIHNTTDYNNGSFTATQKTIGIYNVAKHIKGAEANKIKEILHNSSFSIEFNVSFKHHNGWGNIVFSIDPSGTYNSTPNNFVRIMRYKNGKLNFDFNNAESLQSNKFIELDTDYKILLVWNKEAKKRYIYIDGEFDNSKTMNISNTDIVPNVKNIASNIVFIGAYHWTGTPNNIGWINNGFVGTLYNFKIYDIDITNRIGTLDQHCQANYNSSQVCCNQDGFIDNPQYNCPSSHPYCIGYRKDKLWGTCSKTGEKGYKDQKCSRSYNESGSEDSRENYVHSCGSDYPTCEGHPSGTLWGKCK